MAEGAVEVKEGQATLYFESQKGVFYNPPQIPNRDLSVLVLRLGANAVLAKWVGCAYLFGAWFVLASGLYLGSVNAQVAETLTVAVAIAVAVVGALTLALALARRQTRCHSRRPMRMHDATTNPSPRRNCVSSTPTPIITSNLLLTRYTTPWHWLLYALASQSDLAYPILVSGLR